LQEILEKQRMQRDFSHREPDSHSNWRLGPSVRTGSRMRRDHLSGHRSNKGIKSWQFASDGSWTL
jgi:hypothetical protein